MLKRVCLGLRQFSTAPAAFGRLCVETYAILSKWYPNKDQPPSGGCVLKPIKQNVIFTLCQPAAFGRLCVETNYIALKSYLVGPAAFGRLCVETMYF